MHKSGFTLIEVLIAVAILSIALAGILSTFQMQIRSTKMIQDRLMQHWIGKQGLAMINLGLINFREAPQITEKTILFGNKWYWRVRIKNLNPKELFQITILTSKTNNGEFKTAITGYHVQLAG